MLSVLWVFVGLGVWVNDGVVVGFGRVCEGAGKVKGGFWCCSD